MTQWFRRDYIVCQKTSKTLANHKLMGITQHLDGRNTKVNIIWNILNEWDWMALSIDSNSIGGCDFDTMTSTYTICVQSDLQSIYMIGFHPMPVSI